jgi:alcohol dehydrogenase, propanol-preferring
MKAMLLDTITNMNINPEPLHPAELKIPQPGKNEILLKVRVCGVCHTELDEIEGRTSPPNLPVIPGHQVVGFVEDANGYNSFIKPGTRVGVAWIYSTCGICNYCKTGRENLCSSFLATGRDKNGGYAEYMVAHKDYVYEIPKVIKDEQAAPLLCAGAVGYRSLLLTGMQDGQTLGLTGFGSSAHLVLKLAKYLYPHSPIFVFARNIEERKFALELGATWAGDTIDNPPDKTDAIIDTTPVWTPVIESLKNLCPGGRLVINAIRKEDTDKKILESIDYSTHLWMEKEIKSVANVTRKDVTDFLELAARIPIISEIQTYRLSDANVALREIKERKIKGAKVLVIQ